MPLNDLQRFEIHGAIEHFFYDLPTTPEDLLQTIADLNTALLTDPVKPAEQKPEKEAKEPLNPPANPYTDFAAVLYHPESKLQSLEKKNWQPVLVQEVQEYILFYCICRLQYQADQPPANEEFDVARWLLGKGWQAAELDAPWDLTTWLTRLDAHTVMAALGLQSRTILATLQQGNNHLFATTYLQKEDALFTEHWELPPQSDRLFDAVITERQQQIQRFGLTRFDAKLDLEIHTRLSPDKTETKPIPNFAPYPVSPRLTPEQLKEIEEQLNTLTFATPALRNHKRNALVEALESRLVARLRDTIKRKALALAEKEAIQVLYKTYGPIPKPATEQKALDNPPALPQSDTNLTESRFTPERVTPSSVSSVSARTVTPDLEMNLPAAAVSTPVTAVSALALQPFASVVAEVANQDSDEVLSPDSELDSPFRRELDEKFSEGFNATPPTPIKTSPGSPPPGYRLLTYTYYHKALTQGWLTETELESYTQDHVTILATSGVRYLLQRNRLDRHAAMAIKPGLRQLLESPFYQHYFEQNPQALSQADNVTPEQASCLAIHFVTHLIASRRITLETACAYPLEVLAVITHQLYGNYLCAHPDKLALLTDINADTRDFLLNETITRLFQTGKLTLEKALILKAHQPKHHLEVLLDPVCRELFLQDKLTLVQLATLRPEGGISLRKPQVVELILQDVITEDVARHLTYAERERFAMPHIHQLLLARKITPAQVKRFSPMLAHIVEHETYADALAAQPEFIAHLQTWNDAWLQRLLASPIRQLFADQLITFQHFQTRTETFFPILTSDRIVTLIMEGKLRLPQALAISSNTLNAIHHDDEIYDCLHTATDNAGQADFVTMHVWPLALSRRLFALYDRKPERLVTEAKPDSLTAILTEMEATATGEKLSVDLLRQKTVECLLKRMRDDLKRVLKGVPEAKVPACLTQFIRDVDRRCRGDSTLSWVETLSQLARTAENTLDHLPLAPPAIRYNSAGKPLINLSQFHPPFKMTPMGIRRFCQQLVEFGALNPLQQEQLEPARQILFVRG